jgi:hypothetical protein
MVLTINVTAAGTYDLTAVMTKARDYGIVSLKVDGAPLGQPINSPSPSSLKTPIPATIWLGSITCC